jgi:hypothetical protein
MGFLTKQVYEQLASIKIAVLKKTLDSAVEEQRQGACYE